MVIVQALLEFSTPCITGGFQNPRHYWGFSKPQALVGVFETPCITRGFRNLRY